MEKNIFENAYFGKAYRTKSGDKVILVTLLDKVAYLLSEHKVGETSLFGNLTYEYRLDGICKEHQNLDIVSEWYEEINEEEVNKIAYIKANEKYPDKRTSDTLGSFEYERNIFIEGFKACNIEPNFLFIKKIGEEELDELAENIVDTFLNSDYTEGSISYRQLKNLVKAAYHKAIH